MSKKKDPNSNQLERRRWTRDELVIAFNCYCRIPFGQMHRNNPALADIARIIERTPSAVAMKLVNFASLDPAHQARNVVGLKNASKADREVWSEFHSNWEALAVESQQLLANLSPAPKTPMSSLDIQYLQREEVETETTRIQRVRLVQGFFRQAVLASYEKKCAICQLTLTELLVASHIIPWSKNKNRRADPTNGLALCALHDRAFDRGLVTVDRSFRVVLSARARQDSESDLHVVGLHKISGRPLTLPQRFPPDEAALEFHRNHVFIG